MVKIVANNVYTRIEGLDANTIDVLNDKLAYRPPNYYFTKDYKEGKWDGWIRLFHKRFRSCYSGLRSDINEILDECKVFDRKFVDRRVKPEPNASWEWHGHQLRDYQQETIDLAIQKTRGIISIPTGGGKTIIASSLCKQLGLTPFLFLVMSRDLLYQSKDVFTKTLNTDIGQIGDGIVDIKPITIATCQTIIRAIGKKYEKFDDEDVWKDETDITGNIPEIRKLIEETNVVFLDECDVAACSTVTEIMRNLKNTYYRFGASAYPEREDGGTMVIKGLFGKHIVDFNCSDLIDRGFLVKPMIYCYQMPEIKDQKTYPVMYKKYIVNNPVRNNLIQQFSRGMADMDKSVLILVKHIAHGEILQEYLPEAEFLSGKDSALKRKEVFDDFRKKKIKKLIVTTLADYGLDIPSLDCLVMAGGGWSLSRTMQRIGRTLRPFPGKAEAYVLDFIDSGKYLEPHSQRRIRAYRKERNFNVIIKGTETTNG